MIYIDLYTKEIIQKKTISQTLMLSLSGDEQMRSLTV
jgi:hypothetical protein